MLPAGRTGWGTPGAGDPGPRAPHCVGLVPQGTWEKGSQGGPDVTARSPLSRPDPGPPGPLLRDAQVPSGPPQDHRRPLRAEQGRQDPWSPPASGQWLLVSPEPLRLSHRADTLAPCPSFLLPCWARCSGLPPMGVQVGHCTWLPGRGWALPSRARCPSPSPGWLSMPLGEAEGRAGC